MIISLFRIRVFVVLFIFPGIIFAFSPMVAAAVKMTPELKRIHSREVVIDRDIRKCENVVDEKARLGFESIDACGECSEEAKQNNRAQLERMAERDRLKCALNGLDAKFAFVDRKRKEKMDVLKKLRDQYLSQVDSYKKWNAEVRKNYDDALKQVLQTSVGAITEALLSGTTEQVNRKIDKLLAKVNKYKDARKFKDKELRIFLKGIRGELRGKNREEAGTIVRGRLEALKLEIEDLADVTGFKSDQNVADVVDALEAAPVDDKFGEKFEEAYKCIVTGSELVSHHSAKALGALSKGLGVIALAPDAMNAGFMVWTASVDSANIGALDQLRDASNQKLRILSQDMNDIVSRENELKRERATIQEHLP